MSSPFVSVIVPVYNDSARLESCLRCLAAQTYASELYEVVVIDNGSEEDLRSLVAGYPGFRYEREDQVGSYAARNQGIEASKGDILAFTDSDCLPEAGWLQAGVEALKQSQELGAVGGRIEMIARNEQRVTAFDLHDLVWGMPQRLYIERFGIAATGNLFARREVFEKTGPFDSEFRSCGDCEWSLRLNAAGLKLGYSADARVLHPTRSSMSSFVRRRRRIAGGFHLLAPRIDRLYPDSDFVIPRSLSGSINKIRRSFRHRRLHTRWRKIQFAFVELLLWIVTTFEALRLRLGGEPTRS